MKRASHDTHKYQIHIFEHINRIHVWCCTVYNDVNHSHTFKLNINVLYDRQRSIDTYYEFCTLSSSNSSICRLNACTFAHDDEIFESQISENNAISYFLETLESQILWQYSNSRIIEIIWILGFLKILEFRIFWKKCSCNISERKYWNLRFSENIHRNNRIHMIHAFTKIMIKLLDQ